MRSARWALGFVALSAGVLFLYLAKVPAHPPGFYIDESSIAYNAYTISQTGCDEYGAKWPLFFRAFGEYKNPTLIYLLALVFRFTGPSIAVARAIASVLGWIPGLLVACLAWRLTKQWIVVFLMAIITWLTPWLFEDTRLVLEVVTYPSLVALLLLLTAARGDAVWRWSDVVGIALVLGLLTYSYSIGRLLGPLLAFGLLWFIRKDNRTRIVGVWTVYATLLIPLVVFSRAHPGALTSRFNDLTYVDDLSPGRAVLEFCRRYLGNINPWHWLATGENNVRDHLPGPGPLLAISVVLSVAGLALVLRKQHQDPWWRFVLWGVAVSVAPASLTRNEFPQLRLIAFPVFFVVLAIPTVVWVMRASSLARWSLLGAITVLAFAQGLYFQILYHRNAPSLWYVFDGRFQRKVLAPALQSGQKPIHLFDAPGKSGYIQALWHGVLQGLSADQFVRVSPQTSAPAGSVVISTEEVCSKCELIARSLNYIVYAVPPYSGPHPIPGGPLTEFHASILVENTPSTLSAGEKRVLSVLIKNTGAIEWPSLGTNGVCVGARWRDATGRVLRDDTHNRLAYDLEPGDTAGVLLEVTTPVEPGDYVLEIDALQEQVAWFNDRGSPSTPLKVKVR
jgi:4-amino-4-deoxy-L-arabinose transferase-like glycosyltransferase